MILDWIKQRWLGLLEILGAIVGLLTLRQYFQKDLKATLENADAAAKDAVLNQQKSDIDTQLNQETQKNQQLEQNLNKPAPNATQQEIEDFYKKRLS